MTRRVVVVRVDFFGQIREERAFRRFSLRGMEKARAEWKRVCATATFVPPETWCAESPRFFGRRIRCDLERTRLFQSQDP